MASVTESTLKQYNTGLKLWWSYCIEHNINVFSVTTEHLLKFLTKCFQKGNSYGTLNSHRSAISQIASCDLSNDFRIKRFFRGIYGLRPNLPKYEITWDPSIVLKFLAKQINSQLNLRGLTQKTLVLLLLATGQRIQSIASIECQNITETADGINIKIPKRLKTSGRNKYQPNISLPFFNNNKQLCVAGAVKLYLEKTSNFRNALTNNLFMTHKKPFRNASSQTLSRWVKNILDKSGIDSKIFTAYSTRHAATSAAARKGVSIDVIRQSAGWSEKSGTFAKFYLRPIHTNNFSQAVLNC